MVYIKKYNRLQDILNSMIVPNLRKNDLDWLVKNLGIKNYNHSLYSEAILLIEELIEVNKSGVN